MEIFSTPGAFSLPRRSERLMAQDQFARAERLCDVIIRAQFEADDLVDFLRLGREHNHRDVPRRRGRP